VSPASGISGPVDMTPQTDGTVRRWRRVFDGDGAQVKEARTWLAGLLPACPARDDVVSVASELCANAIAHTASGQDGFFAVEITWQGATVRVACADSGAPNEPHLIDEPLADGGRGLVIVASLCSRTGVCGDHRGRLVWGDVFWDGPPASQEAASEGHEAAIRDALARLAHRYQGVPTWFGRSTLQWWALTGRSGAHQLVTAPTPRELGELIDAPRGARRVPPAPGANAGAARADCREQPAKLPVPPRSHPSRIPATRLTLRPS
jgi:hypothetical protein